MKNTVILLASTLFAQSAMADIMVYSGRSKSLVQPIIKNFEVETGIKVNVKYGKSAQLALTLVQEGKKSPADIFWAQDAGALGSVSAAGLFTVLPKDITKQVPQKLQNNKQQWVPVTGRARVLAYKADFPKDKLPKSIFDLTKPEWKGKVGWAPTNGSFQAFVSAMRVEHGDDKTLAWLKGMKDNKAVVYPKNTPIIQALSDSKSPISVGLPNHYYLLRFKKSNSKFPVEQTFFGKGDIGNLVNIAGAGILKTSKQSAEAKKFINYLLSSKAQQYFTSDVFEYPMNANVIPNTKLVDQKELISSAPSVDLNKLSDLQGTRELLKKAGLL